MAMTRAEDNDTPDQSPSERENVAGNEVGQRIGKFLWNRYAADRLVLPAVGGEAE